MKNLSGTSISSCNCSLFFVHLFFSVDDCGILMYNRRKSSAAQSIFRKIESLSLAIPRKKCQEDQLFPRNNTWFWGDRFQQRFFYACSRAFHTWRANFAVCFDFCHYLFVSNYFRFFLFADSSRVSLYFGLIYPLGLLFRKKTAIRNYPQMATFLA